eukprot:gene11726-5065_t
MLVVLLIPPAAPIAMLLSGRHQFIGPGAPFGLIIAGVLVVITFFLTLLLWIPGVLFAFATIIYFEFNYDPDYED